MDKSVEACTAAIAANQETLGLEEGAEPSIDVWHLMFSIRAFCIQHNLDPDEIWQEVKDEGPQTTP